MFHTHNPDLKINGNYIKEILVNSGFEYYNEIFEDYNNEQLVFVNDSKYIYVNNCEFSNMWRRPFWEDDFDELDAYFYVKGILVPNFRSIGCYIPYSFAYASGILNYKGTKVKLDVSRNSIIGGENELNEDFCKLILKYFIDIESDEKMKSMLTEMEKLQMNYS